MTELEVLLNDCELVIRDASTSVKQKLEAVNATVQVKLTANKTLYYKELYRDSKKLFIFYLEAIDERKYEYDLVNHQYLLDILNIFAANERIALLSFLVRKLKSVGLEDEIPFFYKEKTKSELQLLIEHFPKKGFILFSKAITYNIWSISMTILVSYLTFFVITLPSFSGIILFQVEYTSVSDSFMINHIANTLLGMVGLNSDDFVKPINFAGVILVVVGKLSFIILILNICISKIMEIFKSTF
jgi:hypothetical protein